MCQREQELFSRSNITRSQRLFRSLCGDICCYLFVSMSQVNVPNLMKVHGLVWVRMLLNQEAL